MRKWLLTLVCLLASTPGWGRVLLRWNQPSIPAAATLGFKDVVVSWDAEALIRNARTQGYRVYAEVPAGKAAGMARSAGRSDLAGIVLNPGDSQPGQVAEDLTQLRAAFPGVSVLVLDPKAKQPQMKGQLVVKRDGILQVTSPTAQPWIDSNLALIRLDQAFRPAQTPLYEFAWDLSDPQQQETGPSPGDYALAVAEAGAFRADLILDLYPSLLDGLSRHDPAARTVLNQIKRYLAFISGDKNAGAPEANVGVITDSYQKAYEPLNLFARHNIPFAVLRPSDLKPESLERFALVVLFATPDEPTTTAIADFASKGGTVVVVAAHGTYSWQSGPAVSQGENSLAYATGQGRIIELKGSVIDPETFAQDIRRLLEEDRNKDKLAIGLWNALTVVAVPYRIRGSGDEIVELVNYAEEPISVQVQVKGSFSSIRYETPDRVCCDSLTPVQRGAFTEFVIPSLRIAARVHLANGKLTKHKTEVK
ncbi:MAG: hypothetical protein ACRD20_17755 [Terriglobales bacterium]